MRRAIAAALAIWALGSASMAQTRSAQALEFESLPDAGGHDAIYYLGVGLTALRMQAELRRLWLEPMRGEGPMPIVWFTAEPALSGVHRGVRFDLRYTGVGDGRFVHAQRVEYRMADLWSTLRAEFPTEILLREFRGMGANSRINWLEWARRRERLLPDARTLALRVPIRRMVTDERSCPALRAALDRIAEAFPLRGQIYGVEPRSRPDGDELVITGDGVRFHLSAQVGAHRRYNGRRAYSFGQVEVTGNADSAEAEWIQTFERDTAGCWRADDGPGAPRP